MYFVILCNTTSTPRDNGFTSKGLVYVLSIILMAFGFTAFASAVRRPMSETIVRGLEQVSIYRISGLRRRMAATAAYSWTVK
jgi:hypothetical protein